MASVASWIFATPPVEPLQVEPGRHLVICGHNGAGKPGPSQFVYEFQMCLSRDPIV